MCKNCCNEGVNENIKEEGHKKIFIYRTEFDSEICLEDEYKNIVSSKISYCPLCGEKINDN